MVGVSGLAPSVGPRLIGRLSEAARREHGGSWLRRRRCRRPRRRPAVRASGRGGGARGRVVRGGRCEPPSGVVRGLRPSCRVPRPVVSCVVRGRGSGIVRGAVSALYTLAGFPSGNLRRPEAGRREPAAERSEAARRGEVDDHPDRGRRGFDGPGGGGGRRLSGGCPRRSRRRAARRRGARRRTTPTAGRDPDGGWVPGRRSSGWRGRWTATPFSGCSTAGIRSPAPGW